MPDIEPGILGFWDCVTACDSQVRTSMSGPYALDWSVVIRAARAFDLPVTARFFRLLRIYESAMLAAIKSSQK